jgi:hypothetical protein
MGTGVACRYNSLPNWAPAFAGEEKIWHDGGDVTTRALLPDPATPLSHESAGQAFADILDAKTSEEAVAEFLIGLSDRGEGNARAPDPDRRAPRRDRRLRHRR